MPQSLLGMPAVFGAQLERATVVAGLDDGGGFDLERFGRRAAGLLEQVVDRGAGERVLAQPRDRGLRGAPALELLLDQFLVGDVHEHPVPERRAVRTRDDDRAVSDPDDMPVLVEHAVIDEVRGRVVGTVRRTVLGRALRLCGQCLVAIIRVQLARPERRIARPLLDREAQNRQDPFVHVLPGAVLAGDGDVDDRRQALDDRLVVTAALGPAHVHVFGYSAAICKR